MNPDPITELTNSLGNMDVTSTLDQVIQDLETVHFTYPVAANDSNYPSRLTNLLPLEVANYYCKAYFDDEDFVYLRLELPEKIISIGSHGGRCDLIEFLASAQLPSANGEVFHKLATLYQYIVGFYHAQDTETAIPDDFWPVDFASEVVQICQSIAGNCSLDMTTAQYDYLNAYNREVFYGLGVIIQQIKLITGYYGVDKPISTYQDRHAIRFIRLVNNLCVIMLYVNYYFDEFEDPNADHPVIPDEWQLGRHPTS